MRIAVVIPVYNRAKLVLEAVASVLGGRRPPEVIVVVDDGSTDGTGHAIAAEFDRSAATERPAAIAGSGGAGPAVRRLLLRTTNRGVGAARKAGLAAAVAAIGAVDAVAFLDSDDLWPPCFLLRAEAALAAAPHASVVLADRRTLDLRNGAGAGHVDDLSAFAAAPLLWIARNGAGIGSCALIRADTATAALASPDAEAPTGQDIPFFAHLAGAGACLRMAGSPVVLRRNHDSVDGQAANLCCSFDDAAVRWAALVDTACADVLQKGSHDPATDALRQAVAGRWISAAKDCGRRGRFGDARDCLRRAREHGGPAWRILRIEFGLVARRGWSKLRCARTA